MSSILEALKELEANKAPAAPGTGEWAQEPIRQRSELMTLVIVGAGLLLGAIVVALAVWFTGSAPAERTEALDDVAPAADVAPPDMPPLQQSALPEAVEPEAVPGARPAWLERVQPPRARVASAGSPPDRAFSAPSAPRSAAPPEVASPGQGADVAVRSISYSPDGRRRSATVRVNGQVATVHEGESVHGIEVQLILPGSVYVRHGAEIVVLEPER
jgi:hypothetical protein